MATKEELQARFGDSTAGNFHIVDTIGVPHPYCVGTWHVAYAADYCGGILGKSALEDGERNGYRDERGIVHRICCETCKGKLKYDEHKSALLVGCRKELKGVDGKVDPELHAYLLQCVEKLTTPTEYEGFAFVEEK